MEFMVPAPATDFNFDSACSSPYISAPSSPKRFGEFFSAPTSPTRISAFYREFNNFNSGDRSSSVIPFDWEEKPGKPKSNEEEEEDDFAFDFSGQLEKGVSLTAEELFDGGKIRPLKPPPRLQLSSRFSVESTTRKNNPVLSPKSPRSPISQGRKVIREAFSPRHKRDVNPFAAAIEQARSGTAQERGRERVSSSVSSNSNRRGARSLSPFRVSEFAFEEQQQQESTKPLSSSSSIKGNRKWRLKDFLLFRSASEGRASDKDPLRKFSAMPKKNEDVKCSSFRSTDSSGSVSRSSLRKGGPVSAHELHYTVNRAVSEQMKRKTFLPYKHGLFGCLGFSPAVHGLTKGFGSLARE